MGKKKNAPRPQSINISGILTERFQNDLLEIRPCLIPIGGKMDEEKDHIVTVKYHGADMRDELNDILARAKEEVATDNVRLYLHACQKIFSRDENNKLLKELKLYYRLKSLKDARR
ncbi:MAG: hypothetical protein N3B16_04490 [Candidatus Aminicenantes bacterium]|nr:hypothetical protein [Candidatus Aminicenantes bacterium]